MAFVLVVVAGPDKGQSFALDAAEPLVVGRGKATPTHLSDPRVSRQHCQVHVRGDEVLVLDSGSAGGTFVNGRRADQQQLKPGDVIQVGDTRLRLETRDAEDDTIDPPGMPVAPALPAERMAELAGTRLFRYDLGRLLAQGRSGLVFQAKDKDGKALAVKVLWPEFSKDPDEVKRFVRAMKTMIPVRHPHLVAVYNAGKTGVYCWIAMELVEGESAAQFLQRAGGGAPDWRFALRVAAHVCRGLVFAHYHRIIHRDIAPQNVLIRAADSVAKLGDLMLAKALDSGLSQVVTRPGELLGDVRYMSPERTAGGGEAVDARADLYGLGATAYALVTGKPPLEGDSPIRTILKIRQEKPAPPRKAQPALPARFDAAIMKTLAKRPDDRFQTAAELLGELEAIARAEGVTV
jgi:serine/threonine protein kinase